MPNHKPTHAMWDKLTIKGHTYCIILIPSKRIALLVWNSSHVRSALFLQPFTEYTLERVRGLIQSELEADMIRQLIEEEGLILPTQDFFCIELPYQAIYEGVLGR